jgi:hypothetical protein
MSRAVDRSAARKAVMTYLEDRLLERLYFYGKDDFGVQSAWSGGIQKR